MDDEDIRRAELEDRNYIQRYVISETGSTSGTKRKATNDGKHISYLSPFFMFNRCLNK